jgi:hypothetical protein
LRGGKGALQVNWFEIEIVNRNGEVTYRNSFVTDLPVGPENVAELAACGRARWKIENETFNVLKTKGYNIEHNFGHGKRHLAAILVTLNCWPSPFTRSATSPTNSGALPGKRSAPAANSSTISRPSPPS